MKLTKTEEGIMELIWKGDKVFLNDIMESHPEPRPAASTLATLLKRMQDKGFVGYTVFGNSRQYYALVKKEDYFSKQVKGIISNHFDNSAMQFASFVATTDHLTKAEVEELKKIIDKEIKKKK